jgi:hypothetical protein
MPAFTLNRSVTGKVFANPASSSKYPSPRSGLRLPESPGSVKSNALTDEGVAPPAAWRLEYWTSEQWTPVPHPSAYTTGLHMFNEVSFDTIITRRLRTVFEASGADPHYAAIAVQEWEALAPLNTTRSAH